MIELPKGGHMPGEAQTKHKQDDTCAVEELCEKARGSGIKDAERLRLVY